MTSTQAQHLITGLFLAALAALGAAFAVVFHPTLAGQAATGALSAYFAAHALRRSRLVRKPGEAVALGVAVAVLAIVFVPAALPPAIFAALALRPALHYLNPAKVRVVRTTRGVKAPAQRAAGGRPGKPAEKPHAPRRTAASRPASPRPASSPAPRARTAHRPAERPVPAWPHAAPETPAWDVPFATGLPERPKPLRRDKNRPSQVHRQVCGGCAAGDCAPGVCKSRGCECAAPAHDTPPF
jgi:hypothetical protein